LSRKIALNVAEHKTGVVRGSNYVPFTCVLDDSLNGVGRTDRLNCGLVSFLPTIVVSICCMFDIVLSNPSYPQVAGTIMSCLHSDHELSKCFLRWWHTQLWMI